MWDNDCGSIPVVDDSGKPLAMVTDRDISIGSAINHRPLWEMTAQQVCDSGELLSCNGEDSLQAALSIMHAGQVRRLPVVDEQGKLAGILSMDDLILAAKPKKSRAAAVSYDEVMSTLKYVSLPVKPNTSLLSM
jgi:CBS domain-containing protein